MLHHRVKYGKLSRPFLGINEVLETVGLLETNRIEFLNLDIVVNGIVGIEYHNEKTDKNFLKRSLVTLNQASERHFSLSNFTNLTLRVVLGVASKSGNTSRRNHQGVHKVSLKEFQVVNVAKLLAASHTLDTRTGTTVTNANHKVFSQTNRFTKVRNFASHRVVIELTREHLGLVFHILFGGRLGHTRNVALENELFRTPKNTVHHHRVFDGIQLVIRLHSRFKDRTRVIDAARTGHTEGSVKDLLRREVNVVLAVGLLRHRTGEHLAETDDKVVLNHDNHIFFRKHIQADNLVRLDIVNNFEEDTATRE